MFAGIASPDTDPGTPNQKVFYIATEPGTYVKFGEDITITNEIAILYNYVNWRKSSLTDNIALFEYCLTAGINMLPDDRFVDMATDEDAFTVGILRNTGEVNPDNTNYRTSKFIDYSSNYNQPYSLLYFDFGKEQVSKGLVNICYYTKETHTFVKAFDICVGKQMILIPLGHSVRVSYNQTFVSVPTLKFYNGSTRKYLNESVEALQENLDTLQENLDTLQENLDTLQENLDTLQENLDTLQEGSEKSEEYSYTEVTLTADNTELDSEHLWNSTNGTQVNGGGRFGTLRYILPDSNRPASVNLSNYIIGVNNGGFLTKDGEWIKGINSSIDTMSDVLIPGDAYYLDISCVVTTPYKDIIFKYTTVKFTLPNLILNKEQIPKLPSPNNQWSGKKLCIIGTSVAYGSLAEKAYAKIAAERLGFEIIPAGVPGQAIHARIDNEHGDILAPLTYGSTCLSKDEYEMAKEAGASDITIPETPLPESGKDWEPGSWDYNNYYRTWENIFTKDAGVSLWIFATGPNNGNFELDDWNAFDKINWKYTDGSPFSDHRTTFLGAMLYLMDKMYALGNDQRMVLVLDSAFMYTQTKEAFELLHNQWNIPVIDLWGKINTSPKSLLAIKSKDGTDNHPSTFGQEKLGDIFINELLLIS